MFIKRRLFCDVGGIQLLILDPFYPEMEQQIAWQRINEHYFRSISRTSLSGEDRRDNLKHYLLGSLGKFFFCLAMFMENSLGLPRHFLK